MKRAFSQLAWICLALFTGVTAPSGFAQNASSTSTQAHPSPELSVEDLTRIVLEHNPILRASQSSLEAARAGVTSAAALGNPRLEFQQGRWQPLPGPLPNQSARGWSLSQPIENPSVRGARMDAAESGLRGADRQLAVTRNDLVASVHARVYEALLYQSEAASLSETLTLLEQVRERVRVRVETGEAARYEIIKADAEVIQARQRKQTASLQAEQALLELNRLAAGQLPAGWKLRARFMDDALMPELALLQSQAERLNPELAALRHELDRAQAQLRGVQASRWPGIEVRYSESREPDVRLRMWGLGVQLPLLDQRAGPIAEAQAEVERARIRLEGRQSELRQQVLIAWKALDMARLRVEALSQGVLREAEAALRVAEAAYRFGERGILDVLDAQRVLRGVRADLLQARFEKQAARIALEQLSGQFVNDPRP